ncbi:cyclase family protein [bacterium]|nr:cyclase family protein [bacterium]
MPIDNKPPGDLLDISIMLSPRTVTYPGDPAVQLEMIGDPADPNEAIIHRVQMGSHSGTHIDAPFHTTREGDRLQNIELERLIGNCSVVDCTDCSKSIDAEVLAKKKIESKERVLLKTLNSETITRPTFDRDFVHLTPDGAAFIARLGARLVGIDYLSIGQPGPLGMRTHKALFEHGILVLEGLNLSRVDPGVYELICLPLKLDAPDGAPVRAVLRPLGD